MAVCGSRAHRSRAASEGHAHHQGAKETFGFTCLHPFIDCDCVDSDNHFGQSNVKKSVPTDPMAGATRRLT